MTFRMNCIDDDFIEVERTTINTYGIDEWCDVWEDLLEVCGQPGRISAEVLNKLVYINVIYNCY